MASSSLGTLTLDLIARTGGFVKGMSQAERSSQKWRKQVQRDLKKLRGQFATFAKAAAGAGVAAAGAFTILAKEGLQFVDSQAKMADRLGSTIDDLRALQIAASDFGIEQGKLASGLASYTKRLGDAARGTGEAQKAYEALGLEAKDLVNLPLPEQLALIAERIAEVDSAAERASIADRLMSGGRGLVNLFEEGGGAIRDAVKEVDELGLSLSEIDADKVEHANDQLSRIPLLLEPIKTQIAINLADPLTNASNLIRDAARESDGFKEAITDAMASAFEGASALLTQVDRLILGLQMVQEFQLKAEAFGGTLNRIIDPMRSMDDMPEAFNELLELQRDMDRRRERIANGNVVTDFLDDSAAGIRDPEPDTPNDIINKDAIASAVALAESNRYAAESNRTVSDVAIQSAIDVADALSDQTEEIETSSRAVKDFGDTAASSARLIQDAVKGLGDDPRYGFDPDEGTTSSRARARFEASANRIGDPNVINFGGNDSARPTWSREFLTNPEAEPASPRAPWFGGDAGMAKVQTTASSVVNTSAGGAGRTAQVTLNVVGENGTESATGTIGETLLSMLERAAAGSR